MSVIQYAPADLGGIEDSYELGPEDVDITRESDIRYLVESAADILEGVKAA